jgi:hypothetical protein
MAVGSGRSILKVVSPDELKAQEDADAAAKLSSDDEEAISNLAAFVRREWYNFRNWRTTENINIRLLNALRTFNGEYSADKLAEIKNFGGSAVYARIIAVKCRGATSLLRDVYLAGERPWGIDPTPEPTLHEGIEATIDEVIAMEQAKIQQAGEPIPDGALEDRRVQLMEAAAMASKKKAADAADIAEMKLDDLVVEGGFYTALAEFLVDLPLFPYAVMKGPIVRSGNGFLHLMCTGRRASASWKTPRLLNVCDLPELTSTTL